jgi:hypothetical protein
MLKRRHLPSILLFESLFGNQLDHFLFRQDPALFILLCIHHRSDRTPHELYQERVVNNIAAIHSANENSGQELYKVKQGTCKGEHTCLINVHNNVPSLKLAVDHHVVNDRLQKIPKSVKKKLLIRLDPENASNMHYNHGFDVLISSGTAVKESSLE